MGAQSDKPRGREDSCIKREQMNGTREARATPAVELQSQFLCKLKKTAAAVNLPQILSTSERKNKVGVHRCTQTDDLEEGMQGEAARRRTRGTQGKVKQSRTTVLHYALRMDLAAPSHLHEPAGAAQTDMGPHFDLRLVIWNPGRLCQLESRYS